MSTAIDATDPTLIVKVRIPLNTRSLLTVAAVVIDHPEHQVMVEGEWLALRRMP